MPWCPHHDHAGQLDLGLVGWHQGDGNTGGDRDGGARGLDGAARGLRDPQLQLQRRVNHCRALGTQQGGPVKSSLMSPWQGVGNFYPLGAHRYKWEDSDVFRNPPGLCPASAQTWECLIPGMPPSFSFCFPMFSIFRTRSRLLQNSLFALNTPGNSLVVQWLGSASKQEVQVQSLGQEDPLGKEMATHSSILAWRIPWAEEPGGLQSMGSQRVRHNLATKPPTPAVVRTLCFHCHGPGYNPCSGN